MLQLCESVDIVTTRQKSLLSSVTTNPTSTPQTKFEAEVQHYANALAGMMRRVPEDSLPDMMCDVMVVVRSYQAGTPGGARPSPTSMSRPAQTQVQPQQMMAPSYTPLGYGGTQHGQPYMQQSQQANLFQQSQQPQFTAMPQFANQGQAPGLTQFHNQGQAPGLAQFPNQGQAAGVNMGFTTTSPQSTAGVVHQAPTTPGSQAFQGSMTSPNFVAAPLTPSAFLGPPTPGLLTQGPQTPATPGNPRSQPGTSTDTATDTTTTVTSTTSQSDVMTFTEAIFSNP